MYSQSQFSTSPVNDDVTIIEAILSEGHYSTDSWNNNLNPEQTQNRQPLQWIQESQSTSLNLNILQPFEEPNQIIQSAPVLPLSFNCYQQANCYNISQTGSANQSRHFSVQNTFQGHPYQQIPPCQLTPQRNFIPTQQNLYHPQVNYTNKKAGLKAISKRKRKRTMFTTEQVAVLEKVFLTKPYISRDERQTLVEELQINDKVIKVWFQNRRLKEKREAEEAAQEFYSPDAEANDTQCQFDELSYVESQINHTDKFGYVTLDNRAINGLVNVIDNLLSKKTEVNESEENNDKVVSENESTTCSSAIYEPISPASSDCTSSEGSTTYEQFEPKESLQRIFDIQEFLVFNKRKCSQPEIVI